MKCSISKKNPLGSTAHASLKLVNVFRYPLQSSEPQKVWFCVIAPSVIDNVWFYRWDALLSGFELISLALLAFNHKSEHCNCRTLALKQHPGAEAAPWRWGSTVALRRNRGIEESVNKLSTWRNKPIAIYCNRSYLFTPIYVGWETCMNIYLTSFQLRLMSLLKMYVILKEHLFIFVIKPPHW